MLGNLTFPSRPPFAFGSRPRRATPRAAVAEFAVENRSLYEVLRIRCNASQAEIKTAYRALAKLYHPDASATDGRDFIQIRDAYATLSDPDTRAGYDFSSGMRRRSGGGVRSRAYPTQRWETDQCW